MALADDLLVQAHVLAGLDSTRPKQANLRRSVSTAYYALFHLLIAACVRKFAPATPIGLGPRIARSLAHTEMRDACAQVSRNTQGTLFDELVPEGFSPEIRRFAGAFMRLQEERHRADYDLTATFNRHDTLEILRRVQEAFDDWRAIQNSDESNVFLSALVFARRWSK